MKQTQLQGTWKWLHDISAPQRNRRKAKKAFRIILSLLSTALKPNTHYVCKIEATNSGYWKTLNGNKGKHTNKSMYSLME